MDRKIISYEEFLEHKEDLLLIYKDFRKKYSKEATKRQGMMSNEIIEDIFKTITIELDSDVKEGFFDMLMNTLIEGGLNNADNMLCMMFKWSRHEIK